MKNLLQQYKIILPTLIVGIILGWLLFNNSGGSDNKKGDQVSEVAEGTLWTCSMHPQIQQDKFGMCPICAMDLIPMESKGSEQDGINPNEISMSPAAVQLAQVRTSRVETGTLEKVLYLQGKITEDERKVSEVTARFGGRIEELFVNFTGQAVIKGQKLARVFSPEILTAQKELQEAAKSKNDRPSLYAAARSKLILWSLTEEQINEIEASESPVTSFEILSPIKGIVSMRHVSLGDYVKVGEPLFKVVDLSALWVQFEAYESDLSWISMGDEIQYTLNGDPGKSFKGKVQFIDPVIDPKTRIAHVRVEAANPSGTLRPEMFVRGEINSSMKGEHKLMIPKSSVLWTGKRSLVYIQVPDRESPSFLLREILLGAETDEHYEVIEGLEEGEIVVTNGVFKIDASAQLRGLTSMMNPDNGMGVMGHDHADTHLPGMKILEDNLSAHNHDEMPVSDSLVKSEFETFDVDPLFQLSLNDLYEVYLPMKDAFVLTKSSKVRKAAKKLQPVLESVDPAFLEGAAQEVWSELYDSMRRAIEKINTSKDIEKQRIAFSDFNNAFYRSIKSFGLNNQKVYYQYCPMAFNDAGAYWISNEEIIANPYFGDVMLRCGEVREIIEY